MSKSMLHQLLSVETDLSKKSSIITNEAIKTFTNKANLFMGSNTSTVLDDDTQLQPEDTLTAVSETVPDKLIYVSKILEDSFNLDFTLAEGNSHAKADVVIDEKVIVADAPVLWLLNMETKLKSVRKLLLSIPTLASGNIWIKDENHSLAPDVYTVQDVIKTPKTAKVFKFVVMDEATKEHKAQIHQYYEDQKIGTITKRAWSAMLPVAEKSKLLSKVDKLIIAVKNARQQANTTEVENSKVGKDIFNYLYSD